MAERSLILSVCAGVLVVAALAFAVMPALLDSEEAVATVPLSDNSLAPSDATGSVMIGAPNSLQPADGSAARPTAAFPAFAERGGGIYATEEGEAP